MIDTTTQINTSAELAGWLRQLAGMYNQDLRALSDEAYSTSFAGKARTPQDFTAEVCGLAKGVSSMLRRETDSLPYNEEVQAKHKAYTAELDSKDKAVAAVTASTEELALAIENAGDRLSDSITAPWGQPMTVFQMATIAVNHFWYHDGQLALIQALNGDGEMHWMD